MPLLQLPLELLIDIADYITDSNGECCYKDLNSFVQVNRALYVRLNPILWQQTVKCNDITERIFKNLINTNNLACLEFFLELGANIEADLSGFDSRDELGWPPLTAASYLDNVPMARLSLEKGAKVRNSSDSKRVCAMHEARSAEMVQLLLDHHADLEEEYHHGFRPLHSYAYRNNIAAMRLVLQRGAEVDSASYWSDYRTPLHRAALGSADAVKLLLGFGADLKRDDEFSNSLWHFAAQVGNTDVLRLLMELWPEGVCAKNLQLDTPLHVAAEAGKSDAVRLLVELWPEGIRAKERLENTPLHIAAQELKIDVVRLLVAGRQRGNQQGAENTFVAVSVCGELCASAV
jgi:ankyrin repeat protein